MHPNHVAMLNVPTIGKAETILAALESMWPPSLKYNGELQARFAIAPDKLSNGYVITCHRFVAPVSQEYAMFASGLLYALHRMPKGVELSKELNPTL